jgi:hypothetical protein
MKQRKAKWVVNILPSKTHIEGMIRKGKRHKQLLDDLKEKERYWTFRGETLDHTVWRTWLGRRYGPITRQTMQRIWYSVNYKYL